ncbi:MAG: BrnT family toxin [Sulfurisoma sp.]|nr:BrnT family toxin [Sulfurisoma sp.]
MSQGIVFDFEWDPAKAASNLQKHGVTFDMAATIFLDPLALTVFDAAHGQAEERWLTIGMARSG